MRDKVWFKTVFVAFLGLSFRGFKAEPLLSDNSDVLKELGVDLDKEGRNQMSLKLTFNMD